MTVALPPVCVLGHHELDYPRNLSVQGALVSSGRRVLLCHSRAPFPLRHFILAAKLLTTGRNAKVIYVTEGGHRLVPWVRLTAALTRQRVIFDPFLSRYNTRVEDRQLHAPGSWQAEVAHFQDASSTRAAHHLIFDTHEHRDYFFSRYHLNKPSTVLPVGVDESIFFPDRTPRALEQTPKPTGVLFYGTYIPLQGVNTIVASCALIPQDSSVEVKLIGHGQTYDACVLQAQNLRLSDKRICFQPPTTPNALAEALTTSDVVLGIFGSTTKASRVVPNKVVQAAAMGKAIITADTPAIRRYFKHNSSIYLVPAGSPQALADAITMLAGHASLRAELGKTAREVFEQNFSQQALRQVLSKTITSVEQSL